MKLISCYIENFGNLCDYAIDFASDLTVISEENGFGKTTLAEFIRAMFYGFPRASKDLEKNTRRKNSPWQGGTYGGNLVFEHGGRRYRIERTFGFVPKEDTFQLYDLQTNQRTRDFSEEVGLELFELDAASFERSTYLPQVHDITSFTTSSIQAKLGDLVQDTNDINNFDKAIRALQSRRTSFQPYRGRGGVLAEAERNIAKRQMELDEHLRLLPELDRLLLEVEQEEKQKESYQKTLEETREEMTHAARAASREALVAQHHFFQNQKRKFVNQKQEILEKYPLGIPTEDEANELVTLFDRLAEVGTESEPTEAELAEEIFFSEQEERFDSVPLEDDFDRLHRLSERHISFTGSLADAELSESEKRKLEDLQIFFMGGIPEDETIDVWEGKEDRLKILLSRAEELELPAEEEIQLQHLDIFFSPGVPEEPTLTNRQSDLERAEELRQENLRIAATDGAVLPPFDSQKKEYKVWFLLPLLLGLAASGGGVLLLIRELFAFGGGLLALGVLLLIGAIYLRLKQMVSSGLSSERSILPREDRQVIQKNEQEAAELERAVLQFASIYISDSRPLSAKLTEIQTKRDQYVALKNRQEQLETQRLLVEAEAEEIQLFLQEQLKPYRSESLPFHDTLVDIHTKRSNLLDLEKKQQELQERAKELEEKIESIDQELTSFLVQYHEHPDPERYGSQLTKIQRDADAFQRAKENISERRKQREAREKLRKKYSEQLAHFTEKYSITLKPQERLLARQIRDDVRKVESLSEEVEKSKQDLEQFYLKNKTELEAAPEKSVRSMDELKELEDFFLASFSQVSESLSETLQELRNVQERVDMISVLRDDLLAWTERRREAITKSDLLDKTISLLQKSKDSLSSSYLDTIQQSFAKYMHRLLDEEEESIFVNKDLQVQMERRGAARELGYFSVGQADIVMLCMRFALIEALFKDKKPFVILDDPFVNLDDINTEKALNLLKDLSEEYQIIYLTCNSSREPEVYN